MGVTRPDIRVSADPTIILTPAPREIVNIALEQSGIDPNGKYIGFGLRNWKGLDTALPEIAAAANYAYEKHGLTPVFVPIEFPSDLMPAERCRRTAALSVARRAYPTAHRSHHRHPPPA